MRSGSVITKHLIYFFIIDIYVCCKISLVSLQAGAYWDQYTHQKNSSLFVDKFIVMDTGKESTAAE